MAAPSPGSSEPLPSSGPAGPATSETQRPPAVEGGPPGEPDRVEEASEDSFPASDPPGWQPPLHFGPLDPHADDGAGLQEGEG